MSVIKIDGGAFGVFHFTTMLVAFQMKEAVDKKRHELGSRDERSAEQNFAARGAEGEAQNVGRPLQTAIAAIELAHPAPGEPGDTQVVAVAEQLTNQRGLSRAG